PVDTSTTVALVIVRLCAGRRDPATARRSARRARAEGMVSECHVANDPPVPIGLPLPDGDIAAAAARGRRSRTCGFHLEPPATPLDDARRPDYGESVLRDTAGADRAELGESRLVHSGHG